MNVVELLKSLNVAAAERLAAGGRPAAILRVSSNPVEGEAGTIGGRPVLPPGMSWPTGVNGPLPFLAAVHLGRLPRFALDAGLPELGTLLFFCDTDALYLNAFDKSSWAVRYVEQEQLNLLTPRGDAIDTPSMQPLIAEATWTMPDYFSLAGQEILVTESDQDVWYDLHAKAHDRMSESVVTGERRGRLQIGGNPECEQSSVFRAATFYSNAMNADGDWTDELANEAKQWRLVAQIWSFPEIGLEIGDLDSLCFCMRDDDLREMRFDRAWVVG